VDETRAAAAHDRGQNRPLWKTVLPTVAGLTVTGLVCVGWVVWDWYIGHSPRDLTPDRARVRLVELLDRVYHVGLDPSARVVAAHTARPTYQDEGSDWYLLRLDPARAAQFEADLVARTRAFRVLLDHTHVTEVLYSRRDLRPRDWDDGPPPGVHAWALDPHRDAYAVFFNDQLFLYDSRG